MIKPIELENKILSFEQKLIELLRKYSFPGSTFVLMGILFYFSYYIFKNDYIVQYQDWSRFRIVSDRKAMVVLLGALAPIFYYLPVRVLPATGFLAGCLAWMGDSYIYRTDLLASAGVPIFIFLAYLSCLFIRRFCKGKPLKLLAVLLLSAVFFAVGVLLAKPSVVNASFHSLRLYWFTHPEHLLFFIIVLIFSVRTNINLLLSPTNILNGVIFPVESRFVSSVEEKELNWHKGFLNLALGQFLFIVAMSLLTSLKSLELKSQWLLSPIQYLYFILMVVGGLNVTQAVARLFGLKIPDMSYFLIFSKSPMDVWRRGAVFLYRFFTEKIFVSSYRAYRSYWVAGGLCLFVAALNLFWLHDIIIRSINAYFVPSLLVGPISVKTAIFSTIAWGLVWGLIFSVSIPVERRLKKANSAALSWFAIVVNFFFVSYLFWMSFKLVFPFIVKVLS